MHSLKRNATQAAQFPKISNAKKSMRLKVQIGTSGVKTGDPRREAQRSSGSQPGSSHSETRRVFSGLHVTHNNIILFLEAISITGPVYYHIIFSIAAINILNSLCLPACLLPLTAVKKGEAVKKILIIKAPLCHWPSEPHLCGLGGGQEPEACPRGQGKPGRNQAEAPKLVRSKAEHPRTFQSLNACF